MLGTKLRDGREREGGEREPRKKERNYAFYAKGKVKIHTYSVSCNLTFFMHFTHFTQKVKIHAYCISCNLTFFYEFYAFYAEGQIKLVLYKL